jgi:glycosyltransferase involved in cell wall biosynthesis
VSRHHHQTRMKIGIVTISLNQAGYLQEAIDSVRIAPPHSLAYVIVDPGSQDGSREIIERNRGRFAATILEPDKGPADGLNKGFKACDADIYGYLNSDDRFVPGALNFVATYFELHPETDLLLGAIRILDSTGKPRFRGRVPDRIDVRKFAHRASFAWQQGTFFRRQLFERTAGFNTANRFCWDGELVLDMALAGARIGYTRTILGDFRIHAESITGSRRLDDLQTSEAVRFQSKIQAAGYIPMSPAGEKLHRLKYKYNPWRHLTCAFGISLPKPPR